MNKTTATLMVGLLAMSLLAMTPTVSAHYCSSTDDNCNQACDDSQVHDHYWRDSSGRYQECHSKPNDPKPDELTVCDIYRLIYHLLDGKVEIAVARGLETQSNANTQAGFIALKEVECNTEVASASLTSAQFASLASADGASALSAW